MGRDFIGRGRVAVSGLRGLDQEAHAALALPSIGVQAKGQGHAGGQGLGGEDVETALENGPGAGDGGVHDGVVSAEERG